MTCWFVVNIKNLSTTANEEQDVARIRPLADSLPFSERPNTIIYMQIRNCECFSVYGYQYLIINLRTLGIRTAYAKIALH